MTKPVKMQRRHFEVVAKAFSDSRPPDVEVAELRGWYAAVRAVGYRLSLTNPQFDRERFEAACGARIGAPGHTSRMNAA